MRTSIGNRKSAIGNFVKVHASVKPRCKDCKLVRRRGRLYVICVTKRHKQRQG